MNKSIAPVETARKIVGRKRVLFIEGPDDEQVYGRWLAKIDALYAGKLELIKTGGKEQGIRAIKEMAGEEDVFALLDRDVWDAARLAPHAAVAPRMRIDLSRHCLENYFMAPADIASILSSHDPAKYGPSLAALETALEAVREAWVDHWAMYTTAMRLQEDMLSEGCSKCFHNLVPLPSDADIRTKLQAWSDVVDAEKMFVDFDALREFGRSLPPEEQYRSCIWGKKFFPIVVRSELNKIETRPNWLIDLASWTPDPPAELKAFLEEFLA